MGFWSSVGKVAGEFATKAVETHKEAKEWAEEHKFEDDEFLKRKAKSSDLVERAGAQAVLRSRGYDF